MDIILSIHPEYANYIYKGIKHFEVRRVIPKKLRYGDRMFLYETAPISKVTGYVVYDRWCYAGSGEQLYQAVGEKSCVSYDDFIKYFKNSKKCWGMHITTPYKFENPVELNWKHPPQNFMYVNENYSEILWKNK